MAVQLRQTKASTQPGDISEFERGLCEPSLLVLLRYARIAGISADALIDDEMDLPRLFRQKSKKETKADRKQRRRD